MNVPVFAWDEGILSDPVQSRFASKDLVVSSVPYFDERCGMTFTAANIADRFDAFWAALQSYSPREYIQEHLKPEDTAKVYTQAYWGI